MSVWLCIPSARPAAEAERTISLWRDHGYKIALWRERADAIACDYAEPNPYPYPGYARAVNSLIASAIKIDPAASWFVTGGDDVECHIGRNADAIARECEEHFITAGYAEALKGSVGPVPRHLRLDTEKLSRTLNLWRVPIATFGVMQPTGDRWGDARGAYIDRVAGSPWMGREFCQRMYGGRGPLFEGYEHMFVDEELQEVATALGCFWPRPDLIHRHQHWARARASADDMPEHLQKWNSPEHWRTSRELFERRKAEGFPGAHD